MKLKENIMFMQYHIPCCMRWFIFFPLQPNGDSQAGRICFCLQYDENWTQVNYEKLYSRQMENK